ncbi:hypothetical protein [Roseomonas indoligenes]|uniref:Uncharacterized protein n=1 Tax=Roseomonas indoligenes TaxID=2820811 RepID=A0A940S8B0_9PROT|nr:hypothetical protein [Pararoseomonas indoligenes]MBP0493993.1 hypothetical protein [Pararoseomonas indoligenes]
MDTGEPALPPGGADKAAQLTELRRVANLTGNNLAVWQALALLLGGRGAWEAYDPATVKDEQTVQIPAWCAQYLLECALNVGELADKYFDRHIARGRASEGLSARDTLELLPRALGLTGSGWNAFKRAVSTWESLEDWRMFREAKARGLTSTEGVEEVRRFRGLGNGPRDHRAAARRIANGRKLTEQLTQPHP